eukprot:COSAG06_NODE_31073_length_527_cov_1.098131_1_plen_22_part_10
MCDSNLVCVLPAYYDVRAFAET